MFKIGSQSAAKFHLQKGETNFSSLGWGKKEGNQNFSKILGGTKALHAMEGLQNLGLGAEDLDRICKSVIKDFEKTKYKFLSNFSSLCFIMGFLGRLVVVSIYTIHVQFMYCNASIKHSPV